MLKMSLIKKRCIRGFMFKTVTRPVNVSTLYVSCKGREFTSSMTSSRSHGFSTGDLIEHPIFIIEDILRRELGFTDTNIDTSNFDTVYSATSTYKCATSILNEESAFRVIENICSQFCLYLIFNGEGKATIINKKLASAYTSSVGTIDFEECDLKSISKTPISNVKTKVIYEYDHDYADSSNRLSIETSSPNDSDYNRTKALEIIIDGNMVRFDVSQTTETNAKLLAQTLHDLYKDLYQTRKNIVSLSALSPKYLKYEAGDVVEISNVPSSLKLFETAFGSQKFMITKISKSPSKIDLELTQVS